MTTRPIHTLYRPAPTSYGHCMSAAAPIEIGSMGAAHPKNWTNSDFYKLLRPISHLRFYRAICRTSARLHHATKLQTLRLSSCTLRLCRVNKHGFCTTFPVSRSSFTNTVPKWWNCSISNLFWTLRLIVRFCFARHPTKTKLLARISSTVMLEWFGLFTRQSRSVQPHGRVLRHYRAIVAIVTKSCDKIAGVTSVLLCFSMLVTENDCIPG